LRQELGYVVVDPRGAELLFQVITEREERASIANRDHPPVQQVGFGVPRPATRGSSPPSSTRVTFNAHILETGTQSYRLRHSKTSRATPSDPSTPFAEVSRGALWRLNNNHINV